MRPVVVLGIFVADAVFRADRIPRMGETLLGHGFSLLPGGKGSNQAVAAARAGAETHFITRLGQDSFAEMALATWRQAGVSPAVQQDAGNATGAALVFVDSVSGDNAIIVCPGAALALSAADIERTRKLIEGAAVLVTQFEQAINVARYALEIARAAGVCTVLNPAPALTIPDGLLDICDFVTPNETEAEAMTGLAVRTLIDARRAAVTLHAKGARAVIITLGERGALYSDGIQSVHVPAVHAGPVVDTTGAGDAFNGAFAAALARGVDPLSAVRFGCAAAGIAVTRPGASPSMPSREEIEALLGNQP